jgi:uncharacterized protein (DUF1778 family)
MPTKDFLEDKQQVTLYPTKAQHKKLKELAAKRGKNLSTYILDSAFRDEKIHEKLDKIIVMLGGTNNEDNLQRLEEALRPKKNNEIFLSGTVTEETLKRVKPTIPELKEKVKQMEKPDLSKNFRPCPKGGK